MSNFLQFIEEDIEAKRTLLTTMPTKNKRDIKKYNEKIDSIASKYEEYKGAVKKYIETKSKSFSVKKKEKDLDKLKNELDTLEKAKFILNPFNTYLEKLGFDDLIYQIRNYYDFNLNSINDLINQMLNTFDLANIKLNEDDFKYTYFVNEYMKVFLDVKRKNTNDYSKVTEIFEKIYWVNPDIIQHIELNFRKIIKKHAKEFEEYVSKLKKKVMIDYSVSSYEELNEKYKAAYKKIVEIDKEEISDVIELSKNGIIDINNFFEDSKLRVSTFNSFMIEPIDLKDKEKANIFYENLLKLKTNIIEYDNYSKFLPIFESFKNEYSKLLSLPPKSGKKEKGIESEIDLKEEKLEKTNKKIFNPKGLFGSISNTTLKQLKIESIKQAKELYSLYKELDQEYFENRVIMILNNSLTILDLLNLYYSFDYFKKKVIKNALNITNYKEIIKYSEEFDDFAINPTNIITSGISVFEENNIPRVITNRYRLNNINITEEMLDPDALKLIIDKIDLILRSKVIEESSLDVSKIWFITQVEKILKQEKSNQ